jgi:hypothetical protein
MDEISVSNVLKTEKCRKVNLIRQNHLTNLYAAEMHSSCDGVPLKFKKKNRQTSSLPAQII